MADTRARHSDAVDTIAAALLALPTITQRVIAFVEAHPGCTARDIREALGTSAGSTCATLAVAGRLRRRAAGTGPWMYFRGTASEDARKARLMRTPWSKAIEERVRVLEEQVRSLQVAMPTRLDPASDGPA